MVVMVEQVAGLVLGLWGEAEGIKASSGWVDVQHGVPSGMVEEEEEK